MTNPSASPRRPRQCCIRCGGDVTNSGRVSVCPYCMSCPLCVAPIIFGTYVKEGSRYDSAMGYRIGNANPPRGAW